MFADTVRIAKRQPLVTDAAPPKALRSLQQVKQCRFLGPVLGPVKPGCGICGDRYFCGKLGETTLGFCKTQCRVYESKGSVKAKELAAPSVRYSRKAVKITVESLYPETGGVRLNPSIIADGNGYLFAYRNAWRGAAISVVRLSAEFKPVGPPVYLGLNHYQATSGKEDPRLFRFRNKIHVSFTGWLGVDTVRWNQANMLYARLSPGLDVEQIYFPDVPGREAWEKNHIYFEHDGRLFFIYSISPHKVMEVKGEEVVAVHETPTETEWTAGFLRGGCSPVLHRGHYYHFFHGTAERDTGGRLYTLGLAVFEAKPPFRIVKITHTPLDAGDPETNPGITSDVIFPGGAVRHQNQWCIAMGVHDAWSELRFYSDQYVESMLTGV